jgi:Cdc6-like AAA superfamily ATPase
MPAPVTKRVKDWFHLKEQFSSFHLEPEKHAQYFFGQEDQKLRDQLITSLEETAYSERGYRAIVFGRAGRGKTHLAHHLRHEAARRELPVELTYVHCPTLLTKAPVKDLFATITQGIPPETARRFVRRFWEIKTDAAEARVKAELKDDLIYEVIMEGLQSPSPRTVESTLKWLGG